MIYTRLNRTCEIESVKAHGEGDVAEVYGSINELNPIYYKTRTLTGTLPLSYKALGKPLSDYLISGNTLQDGTPTSEAPVDVVGCGEWDSTEQQYKLPPTVNGTEYPIYLGSCQTTRMIKKLVLTGEENWTLQKRGTTSAHFSATDVADRAVQLQLVCTHYQSGEVYYSNTDTGIIVLANGGIRIREKNAASSDLSAFVAFLQQQYAAGTPVTVWYILATPQTTVVNEPLHKIGDYADTVSMVQAGVTIPTVAGANTLTIDTTVQPSVVSITGNIKEVQGT